MMIMLDVGEDRFGIKTSLFSFLDTFLRFQLLVRLFLKPEQVVVDVYNPIAFLSMTGFPDRAPVATVHFIAGILLRVSRSGYSGI